MVCLWPKTGVVRGLFISFRMTALDGPGRLCDAVQTVRRSGRSGWVAVTVSSRPKAAYRPLAFA